MDNLLLQDTANALQGEWGLTLPETLSEEAILRLLTGKVVRVVERGPDAFYQLMYRLDISEKNLNAVFNDADVAAKIARLIYDRQLEKMKSRRENRQRHDVADSDLKW